MLINKICLLVFIAVVLPGCVSYDRFTLEMAVRKADTKTLDAYLNNGGEVNALFKPHGDTLLHIAASSYSCPAAEYLIAKGADVNAENRLGFTPLFKEIYNSAYSRPISQERQDKRDAMFRLLVSKGAKVNLQDPNGISLISMAARLCDRRLYEFLLENGAVIPNQGPSPLHEIMRNFKFTYSDQDRIETVEKVKAMALYLIESGIDVNAKDRIGNTPLSYAARFCPAEIIEMLIMKGAEVNVKNTAGVSPIVLAAAARNHAVVKLFVESGAEINNPKEDEPGLLHTAICAIYRDYSCPGCPVVYREKAPSKPVQEIETVKYLVGKGASARNRNCYLCLCECGNMERALPCAEVSVPLVLAVKSGQPEVVELLLKNGAEADVNVNYEKYTPLIVAIMREDIATVKILLENGADPNLTYYRWTTPLSSAQSDEMMTLLREYGAKQP